MAKTMIHSLGVRTDGVASPNADVLIVPCAAEAKSLPGDLGTAFSSGPVAELLRSGDFKGKVAETTIAYGATSDGLRAILVGTGGADSIGGEDLRKLSAAATRRALGLEVKTAALALPIPGAEASLLDQLTLCAEGAYLGAYKFEADKKEEDETSGLSSLAFLVPEGTDLGAAERAAQIGQLRAEGTNFARDLGHTPANQMTPTQMAVEAERISKENGYECVIIDREEAEKLGMGAFVGVARGSSEPPKFIVIRYDCGDKNAPTLGLIGKGITFDTGGISLKPSPRMDEMKYDMCGSAAVMGAMSVVAKLETPVNVVAAIAASENMPGGSATKPGDVHTSYSGKTIEILNTDAEGRLVMADALSYVAKVYKPDAMVDIATLTGAVIVALGHYGAGVMSNDDTFWEKISAASGDSGERVCRLPIWEEMKEHLKTPFADLQNIADGSAGGGSIAAAAFLQEFVDDIPWAHVDIAGTAWWSKDRPHTPKGASGYGVRLLLDLMTRFAK